MTVHREVYIGTGEKFGFYTLHSVTDSGDSFWGYRDNYIKNLSTEWDKAFTLAEEFANRVGAKLYTEPFDLSEVSTAKGYARWPIILNNVNPKLIPFGKYKGGEVGVEDNEINDTDYFWWMLGELHDCEVAYIPFRVYLATFLADSNTEDPKVVRERKYKESKRLDAELTEKAEPVPECDKRMKIAGEVLMVKLYENYYGSTYKMIVRDVKGFKVFGSVPKVDDNDDNSYIEKGDIVEFMCKVKKSPDDEKFGFFTRPTKAVLVEKCES